MHEKSQIPHKKICLTVFIVSCLILTVFYYDNTILNYAVSYETEEIAFVEVITEPIIPKRSISKPTSVSVGSTRSTFLSVTPLIISSTTIFRANITNNITTGSTASTTTVSGNRSTVDSSTSILSDVEGTTITNMHTTLPPAESEFLVSSSKCKIPNYKPFNTEAKRYYHKQKYKSCRDKKLLTYVTVTDNIATLHVDIPRVPSYSGNGVTCCYSNVSRVNYVKDPDNRIKLSPCKYFENNITIYNGTAYVKCLDLKFRRQVYENVHAVTIIDENIQKKIDSFDNTTNPFSVLFIGIDSISRLNFIRSLPNTYKFVEDNGWLPLKGYNKIDDNTFPNLMGILTGFNNSRAYSICNPKALGKLDKCPIIWYDFRRLGYVTSYAEDSGSIGTFNYRKKGFQSPPTDYYYRSYILATERLHKVDKDGMTYCTGPETAGERIMNLAKDFAITFKNYSSFGFFWMNSFSHNVVNAPSGMDDKVTALLEDITQQGVTNNTIVIFLSDHGIRFGPIRLTDTGWLEERLPFIYVSFPNYFKESFPKEYENFKINSNRLTTPYDLYMTLQHILVLSGRNYTITQSDACPKCKSLFEEAEPERSCSDAAIQQHWCTCSGFKRVKLSEKVKSKLGAFMLNIIHDIIRSRNSDHRCAKYTIEKVLDTRTSLHFSSKNDTYILFQFRTNPKAEFETTVRYIGDINTSNFSISGDISRLDSYSQHSKCVSDAYLKKYCYCSSTGERV